jgi:hypothetical protein
MIFLEIFAMMTHVGFYAMGPGSAIPWILSTELFSQSERAYASAIAIIVNWLSMFCIIMTFVPLFVSRLSLKNENFHLFVFSILLVRYYFLFMVQ